MRCVIALMQHETNTFATLPTSLSSFSSVVNLPQPPSGDQAIALYGSAEFGFAAMIDVAREHGATISVPVAAYAEPSGKVQDQAYDHICDAICADVALGCDAVLLDLHGAMVTQSYDDGEGELLRRIRAIDPDVPIAVGLDFHTNLTAEMVNNATVIDGYRTYPHIDMYETGERAARSLFEIIKSGNKVKRCWKAMPMMTHMILHTPGKQPMKDIMDKAIASADSGQVLNASVLGGFPLADIPHVSLSVVTVEYEDSAIDHCHGQRLVDELCDMAWQRRADFVYTPLPLPQSIAEAASYNDYPVVIADHGDNCGAGGSTDDLTVLHEMLDQGLDGILVAPIWDPVAVAELIEAGEGAQVSVNVGGKTDVPAINQIGHNLEVNGTVAKITDGKFVVTVAMQKGLEVHMGRTVILQTEQMQLMISENRSEPFDLGCFRHAGIEPTEAKYILVKSRQHFRAGFEAIAKHIVMAAGPGVCSSDYSQFDFKKLPRPIYPIDVDMILSE